MSYYWKDGLYVDGLSNVIPPNAIQISEQLFKELLQGQNNHKTILIDSKNNMPYIQTTLFTKEELFNYVSQIKKEIINDLFIMKNNKKYHFKIDEYFLIQYLTNDDNCSLKVINQKNEPEYIFLNKKQFNQLIRNMKNHLEFLSKKENELILKIKKLSKKQLNDEKYIMKFKINIKNIFKN